MPRRCAWMWSATLLLFVFFPIVVEVYLVSRTLSTPPIDHARPHQPVNLRYNNVAEDSPWKKCQLIIIEAKQKKEFLPILLLERSSNNSLYWQSYEDGKAVVDYSAEQVPILSKEYGLATTGKSLALALESDIKTREVLGYIKVFARMTPDAKETVIECLHSVGSLCLMCGDGANDVGALKGSDVGVASARPRRHAGST